MLDYAPTKTQKRLGNLDKSANPTASSPACAGLAGEHCTSRQPPADLAAAVEMADRLAYPALLEAAFCGQLERQTSGTTSSTRYQRPVRALQEHEDEASSRTPDRSTSPCNLTSPHPHQEKLLQTTLDNLNRTL